MCHIYLDKQKYVLIYKDMPGNDKLKTVIILVERMEDMGKRTTYTGI